jgi:hypothetical protein
MAVNYFQMNRGIAKTSLVLAYFLCVFPVLVRSDASVNLLTSNFERQRGGGECCPVVRGDENLAVVWTDEAS